MPADDPPVAAPAEAGLASDEGVPARPRPRPRRPLSLASALFFGVYLAAVVFLILPLLLPPHRHRSFIQGGVMKLDPDLSLFAVTSRPWGVPPTHRVLILPGLAAGAFSFGRVYHSLATRGLLAVVLHLPGQGFSPAPPPARARPLSPYAPAQAAAAVARAAEALGVGPVHLVLHDSALAAGAAFASANPGVARSVTLIDAAASSSSPAFPAAALGVPVLGRLVPWVPPLFFRWLLRRCCVRGMEAEVARQYRNAMLGQGKAERVVEAWKAMNRSFELGDWRRSSEEVRKLPMMVLWSGIWSRSWTNEGKEVAAALPDAKFIYHSGSRWPRSGGCL